jgi:hypothetical protein
VVKRHVEAAYRIDSLNTRRARQFAGPFIWNLDQQRVAQGIQRAADQSAGPLDNCSCGGLLGVNGRAMPFRIRGVQPRARAPSRSSA